MNLFTNKTCHYCGEGRLDRRNPDLWDGFFDGETKQLVCSNCRSLHYRKKWHTEYRGMYSEYPVFAMEHLCDKSYLR
ncbi:MAG: hypothetical protein GDA51_01810 [Ekhidna sp.]|nr:hypothetical protein [Ekhidna sp.]